MVIPPTILLVEDCETDAVVTTGQIKQVLGDSVIVINVTSLADAKLTLAKQVIDVAVVDLHLPDSSGSNTVRELRRLSPHLPILVTTTNENPSLRLQVEMSGVADYICKTRMDEPTLIARAIVAALVARQENLRKADAVSVQITAMLELIRDLNSGQTEIMGVVNEVKRELFGNGKTGIVELVRENADFRKTRQNIEKVILPLLLTAICGTIGTLVVMLLSKG